jgi:hypothetical protein
VEENGSVTEHRAVRLCRSSALAFASRASANAQETITTRGVGSGIVVGKFRQRNHDFLVFRCYPGGEVRTAVRKQGELARGHSEGRIIAAPHYFVCTYQLRCLPKQVYNIRLLRIGWVPIAQNESSLHVHAA